MRKTTTEDRRIEKILRTDDENLNIVPYMRNITRVLGNCHDKAKTFGKASRDNNWDNGNWKDGGWIDWSNGWVAAPSTIIPHNKSTEVLSSVITLRKDGFIHNKVNNMIFYADKKSIIKLTALKEMPISEVAKSNPKVIELLWLD